MTNTAGGPTRPREQQQPAVESRPRRDTLLENDNGAVESEKSELSGAQRDAAHFKMVADRFRALMERRERRLEEAMSDPQTRTDLEAMFPGMKQGDYQTLLAGVRGMEEEDFQDLLAGARKRRQEVRRCLSLCYFSPQPISKKCKDCKYEKSWFCLRTQTVAIWCHLSLSLLSLRVTPCGLK